MDHNNPTTPPSSKAHPSLWFRLFSGVQSFLLALWFFISSGYGCLLAVFRFGDRSNNKRTAQLFGKYGSKIVGMKIKVHGKNILESSQPCVYVCNHQNYFDMVVFGSVFPAHTVAIGKKELKWIPFFNLYFAGAGNFFVDRKNRTKAFEILAKTLNRLKEEKVSILFFPEGTRNWKGKQLLPFKKGAFHLAIQAQLPIVPVVIADSSRISSLDVNHEDQRLSNSPRGLWHGRYSGTIEMQVLPAVSTQNLTLDQVSQLTEQVYSQMQSVYSRLPKF